MSPTVGYVYRKATESELCKKNKIHLKWHKSLVFNVVSMRQQFDDLNGNE